MTRRLTTEEFIRRANQVHGKKYDYSKVDYVDTYTKVCIVCPECGLEFFQSPSNHLQGFECNICYGPKSLKTFSEFVNQAQYVHGGKYDYSQVNYAGTDLKVKIICPEHGEFWQTPYSHLRGHGCPKCAQEKRKNTNLERYGVEHALQSEEIRTKLDYTEISRKGFFTRKVNNSLNSSSLQDILHQKLLAKFGTSDVLDEMNTDSRYPFSCDFYIKSLDLFVELNAHWTHGGHWYDDTCETDREKLELWKSKNTKFYDNAIETWTKRDVLKRQTAKKNNLNYVVLWNKKDVEDWFSSDCPARQDWK